MKILLTILVSMLVSTVVPSQSITLLPYTCAGETTGTESLGSYTEKVVFHAEIVGTWNFSVCVTTFPSGIPETTCDLTDLTLQGSADTSIVFSVSPGTPGQPQMYYLQLRMEDDGGQIITSYTWLFLVSTPDASPGPCSHEQYSVGLPANPKEQTIPLYPNPFTESFTVLERGQFTMTDLSGKNVGSGSIEESETRLGLDLPSGIYLFHLKTENGWTTTRVVKTR